MSTIRKLLDQIIEDGVLTREEHEQFVKQIHEDGAIDLEEGQQIARLFRLISEGKVKVLDDATKKVVEELAKSIGDKDKK